MLFLTDAAFLGTLAAIALVDSLNPAAVAIQLLLLQTPKPESRSVAFMLGIFSANYLAGWLLVLGLDTLLDSFFDGRIRFGAVLQSLAGVLFLAAGFVVARSRLPKRPRRAPLHLGPIFGVGAMVTLLEIPTAFPYLAAIALIAEKDLSAAEILMILLGYNVLFVLPLVILLLIHVLLPKRETAWFERVDQLYRHWLPTLVGLFLGGFGLFLLGDLAVAALDGA